MSTGLKLIENIQYILKYTHSKLERNIEKKNCGIVVMMPSQILINVSRDNTVTLTPGTVLE